VGRAKIRWFGYATRVGGNPEAVRAAPDQAPPEGPGPAFFQHDLTALLPHRSFGFVPNSPANCVCGKQTGTDSGHHAFPRFPRGGSGLRTGDGKGSASYCRPIGRPLERFRDGLALSNGVGL